MRVLLDAASEALVSLSSHVVCCCPLYEAVVSYTMDAPTSFAGSNVASSPPTLVSTTRYSTV